MGVPVSGSRAYRTAFDDFCARPAALRLASAGSYSPLETANMTPSITTGGSGETISLASQDFSHPGAPFLSTTFHAASALLVGASTQRTPAGSCQVVSEPTGYFGLGDGEDTSRGPLSSAAESN